MDENSELRRLLPQAQNGDPAARDALLGLLRGRARRYADYLLRSQPGARLDASDIAHEALVRVLARFDPNAFPTVPHLLAWLNTIVRNVVTDLRRHDAARTPDGGLNVAGGDLFPGLMSDTTGPEVKVSRSEDADRLTAALANLTENQRLVFALRFREGLSFEEIAARIGVSAANARVLMFRATESLQKLLGEQS